MSDRAYSPPMRANMAVAILSAPALASCVTSSPAPASEERRISFDCGAHPAITVIFTGDEARILGADGPPIVLPRWPMGSGFLETPTHSLRGQGEDVAYTVGRMVPIQCRAIGGG